MITAHHEELAALHAMGLLEGAERAAFESELARDDGLQSTTTAMQETAALLALAAPAMTPPAGARARLLRAVDQPATARVLPFVRWLPHAIAAGMAVTIVWLAVRNQQLQQDNAENLRRSQLAALAADEARAELDERTRSTESLISDLRRQLGEQRDLSQLKIAALAALAGHSPEAQAIAVWDPAQESGLLTVERMPAIAADQDYQIWVVDPAYPNPVDGGVFKPGPDGRAVLTFKGNQPIRGAAAFAISLERKGGVPKAEGPIVLLGKF